MTKRNEPCPCGSGKKYKQCCLLRQTAVSQPLPSQAQLLQAARQYQASGHMQQAEMLYRQLLQTAPRHAEALHDLGVLLYQAGHGAAALELLQQAVHAAPTNADFHNDLGILYGAAGLNEEAIAAYRKALALRPAFATASSNLGNTFKALGRFDEALASYRQALACDPHFADVHNNLASLLNQLGQHEEALSHCRSALELTPNHAYALGNLGSTLLGLGQAEEAVACYRRLLELQPRWSDAHNNLGNAYKALEQFDDAIDCYRQALSLQPDHAGAYCNLGTALKERGLLNDAVLAYRQAIALQPSMAMAYNNLGNALCAQGHLQEAMQALEQALALQPDYTQARVNLGLALLAGGRHEHEQAATAFRTALAQAVSTPDGWIAAVWLAILAFLNGQREECASLIEQALPIRQTGGAELRTARAYCNYLARLLARSAPAACNDTILHVIGESHSLSAHGAIAEYGGMPVQLHAHWIVGCKQWHLGNKESNQYKARFDTIVAELPLQAEVLLLIGEIDCRHDEGIFKLWQRAPQRPHEELIRDTIAPYLDYVVQRLPHALVGGVPATNANLETLDRQQKEDFLSLLRCFNRILRTEAVARGMRFLDLYALTDDGNGVSNQRWHLDETHLVPEAYAYALAHYCVMPA